MIIPGRAEADGGGVFSGRGDGVPRRRDDGRGALVFGALLIVVGAWFLLRRTNRDTRERLRRRRSELADVLDEVNVWLAAEKTERPETTDAS